MKRKVLERSEGHAQQAEVVTQGSLISNLSIPTIYDL